MIDPAGTIEALNKGYTSTPELDQFRAAVRSYLTKAMPIRRVREVLEKPGTRFDQHVWTALARDLGVQGLGVPEALGGHGASWVELGTVFQETGRALLPGPLLGSVAMATPALLAARDSALRSDWLERLASGDAVGAFAAATSDAECPTVRAELNNDGWVLDGDLGLLVDADHADVLVVGAVDPSGSTATYLVDPSDVRSSSVDCFDPTHHLARGHLHAAPGQLLDPSDEPLAAGRSGGALALACEQAGVAQRVLEITLAHVATRTQFGKAIGSFQAVKHSCVEMLLEVEATLLTTRSACRAVALGETDAGHLVTSARLVATEAASAVAEEAIQLHGGIGFTWEHDCHLYLRRAVFAEQLLDAPDAIRAELVDRTLTRKDAPWQPPAYDRP